MPLSVLGRHVFVTNVIDCVAQDLFVSQVSNVVYALLFELFRNCPCQRFAFVTLRTLVVISLSLIMLSLARLFAVSADHPVCVKHNDLVEGNEPVPVITTVVVMYLNSLDGIP